MAENVFCKVPLLELANAGPARAPTATEALVFDWARGARVMPLLRQLVGTKPNR